MVFVADGGTGGLIVYGAEMKVDIELSPSSIPTRKSFQLVPFIINNSSDDDGDDVENKDKGEDSSSNDKKKEEESKDKMEKGEPQERQPTKRIKTNAATTTTTTTTGDVRDGEGNIEGDGGGDGDGDDCVSAVVVQTRDLLNKVEYFSLVLAKTIGI